VLKKITTFRRRRIFVSNFIGIYMKKILGLLLATSSVFTMNLDIVKVQAMQQRMPHQTNFCNIDKVKVNPKVVFVPAKFGELELYHSKKGFSVMQDDQKHKIQKCFTDPLVRDINREKLEAFLQAGYLSINQMNDGEFSLKAKGRIHGGGPAFGGFMYWLTKSICYGVLAVGSGAAVVTTGTGVVAAVAGTTVATGAGTAAAIGLAGNAASAAIATTAATSTAGAAIITTAGVGIATGGTAAAVGAGASAVATAITAAGSTAAGAAIVEGAVATTGVVVGSVAASGTSMGVGATIIAGIEVLATAVGTVCGMAPTI
jgi:hypothetical protein